MAASGVAEAAAAARYHAATAVAITDERKNNCQRASLGLTFAPHCTMSDTESPAESVKMPANERVEDTSTARETPAAEIGGRESGLDPVRYGDWEKNGRCIDF